LETGRRGRELIAESIVLHIDADEVVQSRSWEAENAGDFFGMEKVRCLVPVDPHATEVVSEEVVERIAGEKAQAVRNPVRLIGRFVVVWLRPLPEVADGLRTLLVCTRPDTQSNSIESVARILLEDERMVDTVRLGPASADFDIVWKTCLTLELAVTRQGCGSQSENLDALTRIAA
jgi:hypothetical protein